MIQIRALDRPDVAEYQRLRIRALTEHPDSYGPSVEEEVNLPLAQAAEILADLPTRFTIGAFENKTLVGFAGFYQMNRQKMKHKGHVWGMYVVPESRGLGLGRLLLDDIIERAAEIPDLEEIVLAVTVGNDYARMIYVSAGFVPYCIDSRLLKIGERYYDVEWLSRPVR